MQSFSIIVILTVSLPSMFSLISPYPGVDTQNIDSAFAQLLNNNIIQITSTSTFIDDFGNFHVIGEVNNTSFDPQTNILITTILSDTTNNVIVGNHSAFSSIGTLRPGELSSFDILIPDPQIVGKFNFIEFSTSSQLGIEKPANLVLNGSSAFFDNVGNPHITGYIINQGQFPEQLLNFVATFYDNSSLGIVGTQSFGLNVANLTQNQNAPFDITITDNKTKSQAAFYSLNVDSTQSSISPPFNLKFPFNNGGTINNEQFINSGFTIPPVNNNQGFVIDNNENVGFIGTNNNQFDNGGDLDCGDVDERNFQVGTNDPNNFDADGDGIGCESSSNNNDNDNLNPISGDNNSRCPDGSHRSPSGDCERVTDTSGMPRCPDGSHRSPSGDCERVNEDSDNGNNEDNNDNQGDGSSSDDGGDDSGGDDSGGDDSGGDDSGGDDSE